jgi:hypothetical protein
MPSGDKRINFGLKAANRIKAAVLRVENSPYPKETRSRQYPVMSASGGFPAQVGSGGISARIGTNAGSGIVWPHTSVGGVMTNTNTSTTAYSISSTGGGIATNTWVLCSYRGSDLHIDAIDCAG